VIVTFAGSAAAIRRAVQFDPVFALRGDALARYREPHKA